MKRILSLFISLLGVASVSIAQETYLHCDFERGIPKTFATYDMDGNEPSTDVKTYGFRKGKAWISYKIAAEKNRVASSTSWYTPSGTSNDWLVTSSFVVKSAKAILRWNAAASDKKYRDGYSVYVSDKGNHPSDFTDEAILKVDAENKDWTRREVSLAQYKGKRIWVAFVNDSYNKARLYLDEVYAGVPSSVYLLSSLDYIIPYDGEVVVGGQVYTEGEEPINGFTVGLDVDGETYTEAFPDSVINPGEKVAFTLGKTISVKDGETKDYTLWITNNTDTFRLERNVTPYVQRVVAEESTGTWCAWCVRGIVGMKTMNQNHPDTFLGIAVHNGDVMANNYYDTQIGQITTGGYPHVIINRSINGDPSAGELESLYKKALLNPSYSSVSVSTEIEGDELRIHSSLSFADSIATNLRFAYAIVENNVHQPDDDEYRQYNAAYCDNQNGEMGGYENYGRWIPASDIWYQDVARCMVDDKFTGIENSLPAEFEAEVPVAFDYTTNIADVTIFDRANAEVVAMVISEDGTILNAARAPFAGDLSGIRNVVSENKEGNKYDIFGRRVNDNYKGIVIRHGRKYLQ